MPKSKRLLNLVAARVDLERSTKERHQRQLRQVTEIHTLIKEQNKRMDGLELSISKQQKFTAENTIVILLRFLGELEEANYNLNLHLSNGFTFLEDDVIAYLRKCSLNKMPYEQFVAACKSDLAECQALMQEIIASIKQREPLPADGIMRLDENYTSNSKLGKVAAELAKFANIDNELETLRVALQSAHESVKAKEQSIKAREQEAGIKPASNFNIDTAITNHNKSYQAILRLKEFCYSLLNEVDTLVHPAETPTATPEEVSSVSSQETKPLARIH